MITDAVIFAAVIVLIGWLVIPRINAHITSNSSKKTRRTAFLGLVAELKAYITTTNDPAKWVNMFTENAPTLQAEFDKIATDLVGIDKSCMQDGITSVMAYANMNPADIYAEKNKLVEAFCKFPSV